LNNSDKGTAPDFWIIPDHPQADEQQNTLPALIPVLSPKYQYSCKSCQIAESMDNDES
jgi:hypothetical protein